MNIEQITKLTPEQEALIPIIRDEWIKIGLDTTPTDKQKAEDAIALAYECAGLKPPQQFLWFKNPVEAAMNSMVEEEYMMKEDFRIPIENLIIEEIDNALKIAINKKILNAIITEIYIAIRSVNYAFWSIFKNTKRCINNTFWKAFEIRNLAFYAYFDAIGIDCSKLRGLWETAKQCGWWWPFENFAVVTPKPSVIRLDERGSFHGLGEPAITYEGLNLYAYHGVKLPEKYGAVHPDNWQPEWILEEGNTEIKRLLIQKIGYARICSELQLIELDNWQEYSLLKFDPYLIISYLNEEPIYLLKMTCPSTGFIHVLRVPPDVRTAKEAIAWINWGIAPEEFAIQT